VLRAKLTDLLVGRLKTYWVGPITESVATPLYADVPLSLQMFIDQVFQTVIDDTAPFLAYASHGDGGERTQGPIIGWHATEAMAEAYAKGRGWYGGDGGFTKHFAIRVGDNIYVLRDAKPIDIDQAQARRDMELREQTLAKLSDEQLRVLGLSRC
jgi:hypothetical protein